MKKDIHINENGIMDFHTHSTLSDGSHSLNELTMFAREHGYSVIGFTDHVGIHTYKQIAESIIEFIEKNQHKYSDIVFIPGVEITFATPKEIYKITSAVRSLGTKLVLVHGEASFETVHDGTNDAAIDACVDILAHPSYITESQAKMAAKNSVTFELSARECYYYANEQIKTLAFENDAKMVIDSDGHFEARLLSPEKINHTKDVSKLTESEFKKIMDYRVVFAKRLLGLS